MSDKPRNIEAAKFFRQKIEGAERRRAGELEYISESIHNTLWGPNLDSLLQESARVEVYARFAQALEVPTDRGDDAENPAEREMPGERVDRLHKFAQGELLRKAASAMQRSTSSCGRAAESYRLEALAEVVEELSCF